VARGPDRANPARPPECSGGKTLLAASPADVVTAALAGVDEPTAVRVRRELATVRRRGFAVNQQETVTELTAVGVAVPSGSGVPPAAAARAVNGSTSREGWRASR
jgi:IclR family transcriptional regulator, acetate operon repressor